MSFEVLQISQLSKVTECLTDELKMSELAMQEG
jgi:hypothetical protein